MVGVNPYILPQSTMFLLASISSRTIDSNFQAGNYTPRPPYPVIILRRSQSIDRDFTLQLCTPPALTHAIIGPAFQLSTLAL